MKFDEKKMEKAFKAFMKNPGWKHEYDNAPSEECREYLRNSYYFSKFYDPDGDDADEIMDTIREQEKTLSVEDWKYLRGRWGNSPFAGYCDEMIKELQK